ncbi:beta-ketoacyl synthase N-terminal-like domain-containing protein [Serratia proteamaculans]
MHENTSDLHEQRFTSRFTGTEFFLADHQIHGQKTLPAVAYLEMARRAVAYVLPEQHASATLELIDVAWGELMISQDRQLSIALFTNEDKQLGYEVFSSEAGQERIHCQGKAKYITKQVEAALNIQQLKSQMRVSNLDINKIHSAFEKIGIHYGASFKSGMTIYQGEQQVLAQLSLPEVLLNTSDDYLLHPIMMDVALKASIGLVADSSDLTRSVAIPSTMDAISIISACTQKMYAWIRYSIEGKAKVDIDLTDMEGNICVRMRGVRMNTVSQASFDKSNATSGNESKVFKSIDKTPVEQAGSCSVINTSASAPLVVIGGAGLFGICMGVFLKRANIPFKIIEKNADVGGVWFVNRWPGCGCDIPMLAYAYSFEHFKGDMWAKQSDILEYLQSVAKKYGLYEHIEFNTRILAASYDDTQGQWGLALDSGETINAKYFINGANEGLGHRKKMPSIPGMEEFNGMLQHVLECNADEIDFKNKKVAIIGNGTTQVQLVETLQPVVDRLTVYARTPKYLYPRAVYTEQTQQRLSDDYEFWLQSREEYLSGVDKFFHVLNDPIKINPFHPETQVKKYFNRVIDDEWLYFYKWLEKRDMVPDYTPGCSRPCLSHSYHKQIRADNVLLEGSRITRIIPTGIETENGVQDFDIIICATGYDLHEFKPFFPITGRDSADLNNHFEGFPKTYAGSAVSSFPNLFFGAGPGSGTNSTSVTEIYESNCANLLDIISYCESNNIKSIEVKHEEVERFVNFVRAKNQEGSFGSGCSSWYQTEKGENAAIFPGTLGEFREWQKFDPKRYNFEYYTGDSVVELPKSVTSSITVSTSTIEANTKAEAAPVAMTDIQTLVSDILSLFSMITKIDTCKLDTNEPLGSYGIDSIMIAELARKISGRFSITLDAVNLFELSSLAELISLVERKVKESNANQPVQHSVPVMPASSAESQVTFLYNRLTSQRPASRTMHIAKNNVTQPSDTQLDIAIIGMSGVFPESRDLEQYWENINDGKDCIREIPKERWLWEESYGDPSKGNYTKVKWGGFINDVDLFDPGFFHISPLEARLMDPQHRLYLQNVYHAIENAGYNPQALKGKRISVYYSANTTDYQKIVKEGVSQTPPVTMQAQAHVFAPSRVSYMLGLTGPCELIDTACSSSGVSINHAINSIIHDGCEGALVGATNLMLLPDYHSMYDKVGMICEDGRCKTFSADANGYARGEGVGVIFLKPLSQAEKDGDPIIGVIRAISVNHGGKSNSLTTPNVRAQFDLINSVIKKANIDPRQVGLIECHGTGTSLGDPIEVTALKDAYAAAYKEHGISSEFDRKRIGLGSIKSNIGHTEPLAGLAGLIKVLLSLKNKVLPKTLHVNKVNPLLKLEETPFYILDEKKTWERPEIAGRVLPRMAALSTFGIGNTNVHMIIEEYCGRNISPENDGVVANSLKLIPLSANNQEQLKERVRDLFDFICKSESVELASIAYTLQVGREAMEERLGIIVSSMAQLREKLQAHLEGQQGIEWLYQGQVKSNRDTLTAIAADDEELLSTIDNWNSPKNASKLLELWVKGFQFDWGKLYGNARPNRVNLPTYPFAKKRYWISDTLRNDMTSESKDNISVTSKENLRTLSQSTLSLEINNTMSKPRNIELPVLSEMPYESESRPVINNETKSVSASETNVSLSNTQSISNIQRDTSRDNLRTQFANSLAKALYMDVAEINFNKAFIDMGLDSIVAIEWVKAINEEFGVTISATKLYDYPTIVELAEFVAQKIQDKAVASTLDKGNEKNNLKQVAKPVTLKTDVGSSKFEYSETLSFVLQKELRHSLAKALYMDESDISYEKSFIDLGLDSIVATEWIKSINEKYGLSISATRIYDFPTITQFSAFLASKMKRFADYAGNEVEQPVISEMPLNGAQADTSLSQHAETKIYMDALDESTSSSLITRKTLHEELRIGLAKALYMDESDINGDKAFTDLGLDSIVAIEWVKSINEGYGLTLSATKLYDYPTIAKLAGFLEEEVAKSSPTRASLPAVEHQEMLSAPSTPAEQSVFTEPVYRQSDSAKVTGVEKVAIIGMSGKYPGAENLGEYWDNLAQGKNSIREIPISRWDVNQYFDPDPSVKGKVYSKWLGMLDDIDCFDPLFFQISPVEAELMDPQQRLFLQESYKAFEDAGYAADTLSNMKCGVYLGIMSSEYSFLFSKNNLNISATGTSYAIAAARISYHLNLKGPAIPIDTACSSSLVSIHLACQALINHEVDMALAGGVTLYLTPDGYISMCQSGMLSPEGLCKAFDDSADGFVPGEGVGAVVLKRLSDAEKDGDFIHGVILGSGINQDGKTNGITAPSANSQKELLSEIYSKYKINPETVNYIEAHGTGTKLGDPIELDALSEVFSKKDTNKNYCALASVKSNIGHTSGAAGVASLQKVLLSMKHRKLAPSLHFKKGNAHFDFNNSPFYVNSELKHWESHPNSLRRAGVSAFGFSGTNAHLVLEEYPYNHASRNVVSIQSKNTYIIPISAKNKSRLYEYVQRLKEYISGSQSISLMELAYTLQTGRTEMDVRVAFAVKDLSQLLAKFDLFLLNEEVIENVFQGQVQKNDEVLKLFSNIAYITDDWVKRGELSNIMDLWVRGFQFDWHKLYGEVKPMRISLPTYPFAKERYWLPEIKDEEQVEVAHSNSRHPVLHPLLHENISDLSEKRRHTFVKKGWRVAPVLTQQAMISPIIVLHNEATKTLAEAIKRKVAPTLLVQDNNVDYDEFKHKVASCKVWIDLTGIEQDTSRTAWVSLLQAVIEENRANKVQLFYITQGVESLFNGSITLSGAQRVGLYRMLQSEYSGITSRHVDLEPKASTLEQHVELILQEVSSQSHDIESCYRNGERYVSYLHETKHESSQSIDFNDSDVVLVTGGTRGVGLLCASHLVTKHGVKRLVLTGREVLPPQETWGNCAQFPQPIQEKIKRIQQLQNLGAEVKVCAFPLDDLVELTKQYDAIQASMGRITGIIHSAGLLDSENPAFIRKTPESIAEIMSPKVKGLQHLMRLVDFTKLKFALLFSSVSAAIPSLGGGQSDYVMANAFMDYVANARGTAPLVSIQWPSWKETGMGEVVSSAYKSTGLLSITDEEGCKLLDLVLENLNVPVMMPLVVDVDRFNCADLMQTEELKALQHVEVFKTNETETHTEASANLLQQWLQSLFESELKLQSGQLDVQTSFADYGVDSILLTQILQRLKRELDLKLAPSILLEYSTLAALSAWLQENHPDVIAAKLSVVTHSRQTVEIPIKQTALPMVKSEQKKVSKSRDNASRRLSTERIAVVGMSCRFPGASNIEEYWQLLSKGKSAITAVPKARWGIDKEYYAGLIDETYEFDHEFFMLPPEDVAAMDPQALVLLEESLNVIYHAGYTHHELAGMNVGVYIGARGQQVNLSKIEHCRNPIMAVGQNYLAANISQFFNLRGPSLVIDTACSSSLVGMNMAVEAMCAGTIDSALVGGVSLLANSSAHEIFAQRNLLQANGEFHILDQRASGVVLGEGCGMVYLKPLEKAKQDGDCIYAVIEGIGVNNDGRTAGPATPNMAAQADVMQSVLKQSQCASHDISYLDVNGSGSEVTDLLEIKAVASVYASKERKPLYLGSMKPNIGHPLCAEGIASFIKVALMLQHQQLVPFLSGQEPLAHYSIERSGFAFPRQAQAFEMEYAALNCFADGGTNAHVILSKSYQN